MRLEKNLNNPYKIDFSTSCPVNTNHEINGAVRGLCVYVNGFEVVGEGMGLGGVVAIKDGVPFFPLEVESKGNNGVIFRRYILNGVPKKYLFGRKNVDKVYINLHRWLSPLYLRNSLTRQIYTVLMAVRTLIGVRNRFEKVKELGFVEAMYNVKRDRVAVSVDLTNVDAEKVFVANELSGKLFTKLYLDDTHCVKIGPWMEAVKFSNATICSPILKIGFRIPKVNGCRVFVGREVMGRRLDWAGINYLTKPGSRLSYHVEVVDYGL